jgi:hypothetical protein
VSAGAHLRDQGIAQAEAHADPRLIAMIDAFIDEANASGQPWSANTIRDRIPVVGQGLVGARVRAARNRREMVHTGRYVQSTLPNTHRAEIKVWVGVEHGAGAA